MNYENHFKNACEFLERHRIEWQSGKMQDKYKKPYYTAIMLTRKYLEKTK